MAAASLLLLAGLAATCASAQRESDQANLVRPELPRAAQREVFTGTLRVLTLNVAHGRKDAFNQIFLRRQTIERNLAEIASLLRQAQADVVALQEADGPSRWSGNFDHVALLAHEAGYAWYARAGHANSWLFDYGTALLSHRPLIEALRHDFEPTPPSPTKGLVLGQIAWRPDPQAEHTLLVDIISVHLDFSRQSVRTQQLAEMREFLARRTNPTVILGDFNSDWLADESVVTRLATECGLHAYRPEATDLGTYRSAERRLDWILLSKELQFVNYNVLTDIVSDHYAVLANIGINHLDTAADAHKDTGPRCNK